jgi:hypothetical protein
MKSLFLAAAAIIVSISFISCKKSSTPVAAIPTSSQWAYGGISYKGDTTYAITTPGSLYQVISIDTLLSTDSASTIVMDFLAKPAANGTYTIASFPTTSAECDLTVGSGATSVFLPSPGGQATVTVSGAHISIAFSNVSILPPQTVSGTIYF